MKAIRYLQEAAEAGMSAKHGCRRVFPGKFQFSIVYLDRTDDIVVVAVAPFRRKPGYWESRVGTA